MDTPRAQAKRRQILVAAETLFLAQGFERATMDAIAAAARVSKQTLYRYFPGKEDLFAAVLQALTLHRVWVDVPQSRLAEALVSHDALERTLLQISASLTRYMTDPTYVALVRIVIAEGPRFPHLAEAFWHAVPLRGEKAFSTLLEEATARGLVSAPYPQLAVRLFVGSLLTYVFAGMLGAADESSEPPPAHLAELVRLFVRAIS